ncbi:MAG: helix-turn-helix transcriptional regulator [Lachnospiraceae bacterium]|nr:helix-turn-helix transcriptional regulator [Lachnospiraceae bacterium]
MSTSEQIKILCIKLGISVAELARLNGSSPQAFSQKMKRESFTPAELKELAAVAGCSFECSFILPNGESITY